MFIYHSVCFSISQYVFHQSVYVSISQSVFIRNCFLSFRMFLSVILFILLVILIFYQCICFSINQSVYLSFSMLFYQPVCFSINQSLFLSASLFLSVSSYFPEITFYLFFAYRRAILQNCTIFYTLHSHIYNPFSIWLLRSTFISLSFWLTYCTHIYNPFLNMTAKIYVNFPFCLSLCRNLKLYICPIFLSMHNGHW